jgi:Antibiotic biosynthesis monooxygenase
MTTSQKQPDAIAPFQFGFAVRTASGSSKVPGAVSLTWIDSRSEEEKERIKLMAAAVAAELTKEPGFLSWVGLGIADRLYTITAWESEEAVRAVMRTRAHKDAVKRFFSGDVGAAVSTGVWIPHHLNAVRVLPEAPEYW